MSAQTPARVPVRLRLALSLFVVFGLFLGAKLFYWQIIRGDELSRVVEEERASEQTLYALRGDIETSDGVLLAKDVFRYEIRASPRGIIDPEGLADRLAPILGTPRDAVLARLKSQAGLEILAQDVPQAVAEQVQELRTQDARKSRKWAGLEVQGTPVRCYPAGSFAAHVVGYVNREKQRKAEHGVEQAEDQVLRGADGTISGAINALHTDLIPFDLATSKPAVDGAEIILTIQAGMQRIVEIELERAIRETRASSGSIIVMDPKTGAILALAAYPTSDLNLYYLSGNRERLTNQTVSSQYEPGSVFKVVTLAAALDAGVVTPATFFEDSGMIRIGATDIWNHDRRAYGRVGLVDVMRHSLNVEAVKMSIALGAERFYQYVRDFGFGAQTKIELAREEAGSVKAVGDGRWREVDLGTNAFGQGIAVTPMQMITAVAAVANQGKLMRPYIVQEIRYANGTSTKMSPRDVRPVIRPATAQVVNGILAEAIVGESANKALVPGYRIAGKTGTAQIPVAGTWDPRYTIASFVGYLPADDPRFVILVKLDKPQTSEWGSQVASPVFSSVAKQLVALAGVPPDALRMAAK